MAEFPTRWHEVTVTGVTASAHAAGDALGNRIDVAGMLRESDSGGVLLAISLMHLSTNTFEVDFIFFDDVFQATADDSPFSPTDADLTGKCLGYVKMVAADMVTTGNHAIGTVQCVFPLQMKNAPGTLYCQMVTRTAFTPAGITVKFGVAKD
jgi:hypothetical protein